MNSENLFMPNSIRLNSGEYLNLLNINPDKIHIEDIAHALSHMPRFGGHTQYFYSVAQHSLCVCNAVQDKYKLCALMHDASEAYLMNLPTPLKKAMPEYYVLEDKLMNVIALKFGFMYPMPQEVKNMDARMLQEEWDAYMIGKLDGRSEFTYQNFMRKFRELNSNQTKFTRRGV